MNKFIETPATVSISYADGSSISYISNDVQYGPSDDTTAQETLYVSSNNESRVFPIIEWTVSSERELKGTLAGDAGTVTVRGTKQYDSLTSATTPGIRYPLPNQITSLIASNYNDLGSYGTSPILEALTDDRGLVVTLLVMSDAGAFVRYDRQWIELKNLDAIEGLNVFDVNDEAVNLYDQYDPIGKSIHISELPVVDDEQLLSVDSLENVLKDNAQEDTRKNVNETVQASEDVVNSVTDITSNDSIEISDPNLVEMPDISNNNDQVVPDKSPLNDIPMSASALVTISTKEQLEKAIPIAVENESIRWYIEKRATALDLQVDFPWKESE